MGIGSGKNHVNTKRTTDSYKLTETALSKTSWRYPPQDKTNKEPTISGGNNQVLNTPFPLIIVYRFAHHLASVQL